MPMKRGRHARRQCVIDLTFSDEELEDGDCRLVSNVTLPDTEDPTRSMRLTAAACLRADQIAYGEIDPPPDSPPWDQSSLSWTRARNLARDSSAPVFDKQPDYNECLASPEEGWRAAPGYNLHANDFKSYETAFHEERRDEITSSPLRTVIPNLMCSGNETIRVSPSIHPSPEDEDSSDHDSVFDEEEDGTNSTRSEERHEVVETTASGRPRRACAPRSFVGLMEESTFANGDFVNSEKSRADLIERAIVAHRQLWRNRMVQDFSYSCGRIDDGNARSVLTEIANSLGAKVKVEKRQEPGKEGKRARHVVMKPSTRLRSPSDTNIRESAVQIMNRRLNLKDSCSGPQPVSNAIIGQMKTRGSEKKHCKQEGGSARVETATEPRQFAESGGEKRKETLIFECKDIVNGETFCTDLIQRAIIAHQELWENRLIDGFSHNCGCVDDGMARRALIEIAHSFGAMVKVEKRKDSGRGKIVKHVVLRCGRRLQSPSVLNVLEKAESILKRWHVLSDSVSHDPKDPLDSTTDGTVRGAEQPCPTQATYGRGNATKREFSARGDTGRAGTKESRKALFQQKRQRKLEGTKIATTNKGFSMLSKMGWTEGGRLGARENGISEPIVAQFRVGRSGLGR